MRMLSRLCDLEANSWSAEGLHYGVLQMLRHPGLLREHLQSARLRKDAHQMYRGWHIFCRSEWVTPENYWTLLEALYGLPLTADETDRLLGSTLRRPDLLRTFLATNPALSPQQHYTAAFECAEMLKAYDSKLTIHGAEFRTGSRFDYVRRPDPSQPFPSLEMDRGHTSRWEMWQGLFSHLQEQPDLTGVEFYLLRNASPGAASWYRSSPFCQPAVLGRHFLRRPTFTGLLYFGDLIAKALPALVAQPAAPHASSPKTDAYHEAAVSVLWPLLGAGAEKEVTQMFRTGGLPMGLLHDLKDDALRQHVIDACIAGEGNSAHKVMESIDRSLATDELTRHLPRLPAFEEVLDLFGLRSRLPLRADG